MGVWDLCPRRGRVDGSPVHASMDIGSVIGRDDLAANDRRVDGEAVHPTGAMKVVQDKPWRVA